MSIRCEGCGHENEDTANFCVECGSALVPRPEGGHAVVRGERRTKTGLLLMVTGLALTFLPTIAVIGALLLVVGVILAYLGAEAYGREHKRFVRWSILLWILIFIVMISVLFIQVTGFVRAVLAGAPAEELLPIWRSVVLALAVGGSAFAIPHLLLTYQLQDHVGRTLLWIAVGVQVAASAATAWMVNALLKAFVEAIEGGARDPTLFIGNPSLQTVQALPNLLWAVAYYLAYRRVASQRIAPAGLAIE